jgi:uroporphyrinogen-III synthase
MTNFGGMRVLALESRRAKEMAALIGTYGGQAVVAPAMREVPLERNREAAQFVAALVDGNFDMVVFLTGVGTRLLAELAETLYTREQFVTALMRTRVVARGPKPTVALKELGSPVHITVPEPNTWRELLAALDGDIERTKWQGTRIAIQEHGEPSADLSKALEQRGARVTRVPVYRWALPEDTAPLQEAVRSIIAGDISVVLFTTSVQIVHLFQIAAANGLEETLQEALRRCAVASIGPTTSEELRRRGLAPDLEASHPKMGFLVKEASEQTAALIRVKRKTVHP